MASPYATDAELRDLPRTVHKATAWEFRGKRRSVRIGETIYKRRFMPPSAEPAFLSECRRAGLTVAPSSYSDAFHRLFTFAVPSWGTNGSLGAGQLTGGWQGALRYGKQPGRWKILDMVSAYAWAGLQGLPALWTARPSWKVEPGGLYVAKVKAGAVMLPPHLRRAAERRKLVLVSTEEIDALDLRDVRVQSGTVFRQFRPIEELLRVRKMFRDWKAIYRSYWGRWASTAPLTTVSLRYGVPFKSWQVPARTINKPWAHFILSRVRLRVAELAPSACHVYVDSACVPVGLPVTTGDEVGCWRVKGYVNSPFIRGVAR